MCFVVFVLFFQFLTQDKKPELFLCGSLQQSNPSQQALKSEAVDRDGTETQRSIYSKKSKMLHQGFSDNAGNVLNNLKHVWVTDI